MEQSYSHVAFKLLSEGRGGKEGQWRAGSGGWWVYPTKPCSAATESLMLNQGVVIYLFGCHLCSKKMDSAEINQAQLPERPDENAGCPSSLLPWGMMWWSQITDGLGAASPPLGQARLGWGCGCSQVVAVPCQESALHHSPFSARAPTAGSAWWICPTEIKQMDFFFFF